MKWDVICLLAVVLAQLTVTLFALYACDLMKGEWLELMNGIDKVDVNTVNIQRFWGPSTIVTTSTCDYAHKLGRTTDKAKQSNEPAAWVVPVEANKLVTGGVLSGGLNFQQNSSSAPLDYPQGRSVLDQRRLRRLTDFSTLQHFNWKKLTDMVPKQREIVVPVCNRTLKFKPPCYFNRYFAMIALGRAAGWDPAPSMERFEHRRDGLYEKLSVWLFVCMAVRFGLKFLDILFESCGNRYEQLWNGGRGRFDRALETVMVHALSSMFMLALQLALCSAFLTFWEDDYFLMAYIPGVGFGVFFITLLLLTAFVTIDRVVGFIAHLGDWYIYVFWTFYLIWVFVLAVPMLGYCIYSFQFLFEVQQSGILFNGLGHFSEEYRFAAICAVSSSVAFFITAAFDISVMISLDLGRYERPGAVENMPSLYIRQGLKPVHRPVE